ncbi:MAG TPA: 2-dehydropantoate 2-reductase N-terminal domain-containing protein, partial [Terriglobia bacterium]|nr:2-dehydropantoate 2-reductase N-terminal domain-containing protein [Terriglobia bacterium]
MKIGVIGAGYVGLTAAACLAEVGHHVCCADNDLTKLERLNRDEMPVFEPHLGDLVARNRGEGRLEFGLPEQVITDCQALFICVGTPLGDSGEVDLSAVDAVASLIVRMAQGYRIVIQKSTVPVGSCRKLAESLQKSAADGRRNGLSPHWDVVANPEFL